ncbi:unnamed protein product [Boreogadus saida]
MVTSRAALEGACPLGQFPCGNMSLCLPQKLHCNGPKDCPNGADERHCGDNIGWANLFVGTMQDVAPVDLVFFDECFLQEFPDTCECIQTEVQCVEVNLSAVPQLSPNVTWLNNVIHLLDVQTALWYGWSKRAAGSETNEQNYSAAMVVKNIPLPEPSLENTSSRQQQVVSVECFGPESKLLRTRGTEKSLRSNKIRLLSDYVFSNYSSLERLFLQNNSLHTVSEHAFSGLHALKRLSLVLDQERVELTEHPVYATVSGGDVALISRDRSGRDLVGNQIQVLNYSILKTCSKLEVLVSLTVGVAPSETSASVCRIELSALSFPPKEAVAAAGGGEVCLFCCSSRVFMWEAIDHGPRGSAAGRKRPSPTTSPPKLLDPGGHWGAAAGVCVSKRSGSNSCMGGEEEQGEREDRGCPLGMSGDVRCRVRRWMRLLRSSFSSESRREVLQKNADGCVS